MFSMLLGGAMSMVGSIYGAERSAAAQEYAAMMQYRAMQDQIAQAAADRSAADYYFGLQRQDAELLRNQYYLDANLRLGERDWTRNLMMGDRTLQMNDYQRQLDRLQQLDRAAAEQRAFALQEYLKSQTISASERARALQELERSQEIARGERDFELRELRSNQLKQSLERQFQLEQLQRTQRLAMEDRNRDLATRAKYDDAVTGYNEAITETLRQLGALPDAPTLSKEDIASEELRRRDLYERAIDRAADRASSQNEAALIKSGLDSSSTAAFRRSEVAGRMAPLYEEAYRRAGDDALKYMVGLRDNMLTDYKTAIDRRGIAVKEAVSPYEAMLAALMRSPNVANGVGADWRGVQSAIYDKPIRSANQYTIPLQVGSAFNPTALNIAAGLSGYSQGYNPNLTLATYGAGASGYLSPQGYFNQNPQGQQFLNASATGYNNAYGGLARMGASLYNDARSDYANYSKAFGTGLNEVFKGIESSDWYKNFSWNNFFGGGSGYNPSSYYTAWQNASPDVFGPGF